MQSSEPLDSYSYVMMARSNVIQKPGNHPNFRKNALGVKRPFSELWERSGVFSEQLSEFEIPFSEYEIPPWFEIRDEAEVKVRLKKG